MRDLFGEEKGIKEAKGTTPPLKPVLALADQIVHHLDGMPLDQLVSTINAVRERLHKGFPEAAIRKGSGATHFQRPLNKVVLKVVGVGAFIDRLKPKLTS